MKKDEESPLKIFMITFLPPKEDGVAEYSKCLVESLSTEKLFLYVISQTILDQEYENSITNMKHVRILRIWKPNSVLNQFHVLKEVTRTRPDIVHLQYGPYSEYGGMLGEPLLLLLTFLKLLRFRCVVTLHSIWFRKEAQARAYERIRNGFLSNLASIYYLFFMKILLGLFSLVVVCVNFKGSSIVQRIVETFGISPLKVREMVHGSNETIAVKQEEKTKRRFGWGGRLLLCFGFIRKDKGYEYAIRALSHLRKNRKRIKMIIAGTPVTPEGWDYLATLKALVNKLQLNKEVVFDTRYIPEEDMINYLLSSDVLLLPYDRHVGPSGPLAIAASFGLPIIMTSDEKFAPPNLGTFVKKVPPRNLVALACAIKDVLENEKNRNRMARDAVAYASKYSYHEIAKQHLKLYLSIAKVKG